MSLRKKRPSSRIVQCIGNEALWGRRCHIMSCAPIAISVVPICFLQYHRPCSLKSAFLTVGYEGTLVAKMLCKVGVEPTLANSIVQHAHIRCLFCLSTVSPQPCRSASTSSRPSRRQHRPTRRPRPKGPSSPQRRSPRWSEHCRRCVGRSGRGMVSVGLFAMTCACASRKRECLLVAKRWQM